MNKQKRYLWIIVALVIIAAIPVVLFLKKYYDNRYVLDDQYFTVVPLDYDITPYRDEIGDRVTDYTLTCYNAEGESRELSFAVLIDAHGSDLYPPGTFIRVDMSKQLVIGRRAIDKTTIPPKAIEMIETNFVPSTAATLREYAEERLDRLPRKNAPHLTGTSAKATGTTLWFTYTFDNNAKEAAEEAAELLDPVFNAQFRTDKQAFEELTSLTLEIILEDGSEIFTQKYETIIEFDYEKR